MFKIKNSSESKALLNINLPDSLLNFKLEAGKISGYIHQRFKSDVEKFKNDLGFEIVDEDADADEAQADKDQASRVEDAIVSYEKDLELIASRQLSSAKDYAKSLADDLSNIEKEYDSIPDDSPTKSVIEAELLNAKAASVSANNDVVAAQKNLDDIVEANKKAAKDRKDNAVVPPPVILSSPESPVVAPVTTGVNPSVKDTSSVTGVGASGQTTTSVPPSAVQGTVPVVPTVSPTVPVTDPTKSQDSTPTQSNADNVKTESDK